MMSDEVEFPPNDLLAAHGAVKSLLGSSIWITGINDCGPGGAWEFAIKKGPKMCRVAHLADGLSVLKGSSTNGDSAESPIHAAQIVQRYLT